jgi:peptide chain release factor 1
MLYRQDLRIEYTRGKGAGGQHKNKTSSCVKITHLPTGIQVMEDGRDQHKNKKVALKKLEARLESEKMRALAKKKKADRDHKIHNSVIIRTYDYTRNVVVDHRTEKTAPLKRVMKKGRIDLLC